MKRNKRKLRMREAYLNKEICLKRARKIVLRYGWENVTAEQLAKEIYGHAYVYYRMRQIGKLPGIHCLVYRHVEDGIDVQDKADRFLPVWEWIWNNK